MVKDEWHPSRISLNRFSDTARTLHGKKFVLPSGQHLPCSALVLAAEASSRRGPLPPLGARVAGNPLPRGARPGLRSGSGHMRESGFPQERLREIVVAARGCATRCCPGVRTACTFPATYLWAGTQRIVALLSPVRTRSETSIIAVAKRWPGKRASILTQSMAAVGRRSTAGFAERSRVRNVSRGCWPAGTPPRHLQVSSAAYGTVPWTIGVWRLCAALGVHCIC